MKKVALLAFPAVLLHAYDARACGGFFCNNQPLDQAGEKILFLVDETTGEVTAHIQIQYAGSAPDFSWVVPVTSVPTFDVGSDEIFLRLVGATAPSYQVHTTQIGGCDLCPSSPPWDGDGAVDADADADGDSDTGTDGGVLVLDSGVVGPFETVTLSSDDPEALSTWLVDNGYDVPETAGPIIAAYVSANYYFVGLKLTKESDTGDLRPIILHLAATTPCIPLRLTAIAATPDMPVFTWVLGDARAVSTNYLDVVPNDVLILTGAMTYPEAASAAIDVAGGRAFITEYAGSSAVARAAFDNGYHTDALRTLDSPVDVMAELQRQGFRSSALLLSLLTEYMPPPDGVEPRDFYNCPDCYDLSGYTFDANALADGLEDGIVRPLDEVHDATFRYPTLTRLYTVISPDEMTEDPEFAMNPWAPPVDQIRTAELVRNCRGTYSPDDDYGEVATPNGHTFCGHDVDAGWSWGGYYGGGYYGSSVIRGYTPGPMPVVERAVRYGEGYSPEEVVIDEHDAIDEGLDCVIPNVDDSLHECVDPYYGDDGSDADADSDGSGDGGGETGHHGSLCAAAPGGGSTSTLLWLLAVTVVSIRRRRVSG
jgi:hypothetical protein